jgi:ketosteroid isomerase-like protein
MTTTTTTATAARFDFATVRRAMEKSDAAALIGLYAEDAAMTIIDRAHPPGAPLCLVGRTAIAEFWRDVCGRAMTHSVGQEVVGERRVALVENCAYPDGCRVTAAMTLDLDGDGRIARHLTVQAWDEAGAPTSR